MALLLRNMLPCLLVSFVLAKSHALQAQTFVDGDPAGVLNTAHVGGYLGHGVSFVDFNEDGFDDLCFAQFEGQILAYEGDGEGGFASTDLGIGNTGGEPKSVLWADFDNDGDQDLFITQRLSVNRLYARMPDGSLAEVPGAGGMAELIMNAPMAPPWQTSTRMADLMCIFAIITRRKPTQKKTGFFVLWEVLICP